MTKSNKFHLEGTDNMLEELNNTQGRYVPVWMQDPKTKVRRKPDGNKKRKRTSVKTKK